MFNISDVDVIISASEQAGQAGTWYPLIYVKGSTETTTYKEYSDLTDLVVDYAATTDAYKAAQLMLMQEDEGKPDKFAVATGGEDVFTSLTMFMGKDWRQLIVAGGEYDANLAADIETSEKMYYTKFATLEALKAAKIEGYDRTVALVYTGTDVNNPEAALIGRTAGYAAGSFTYHAKEVKGVTAETFTPTQVKEIVASGGNVYVMKNGRIASHGGVTGSGEWIDVIDSKDYIIQNIRYDVQEVFLNNKKIAYTNKGIAKIENATRNRLKIAYNNEMIAEGDDGNPLYNTIFKSRSETTAADRVARNYPYGYFEFELAGAIHEAKIKGAVVA